VRLTTQPLRSRAFVQPLLLTIVGVVASVVLYLAATRLANGGPEGPCTYGPDACGYVFMASIGQALMLVPVFVVGLLITGLVVGLSSHDSGAAFRAIVVAVLVVPLVGVAAVVVPGELMSGRIDAILLNLGAVAAIGLLLLLPIGVGFGVGSLVRRNPKDQPDSIGPG
jgi:hypothetical protein